MLGLTCDVDLEEGELSIGRQLQRVSRQLLHRETKTATSDATLPLPDPASTPRSFALDASFPRQQGAHDLCLAFTARRDGPLYAFHRLVLGDTAP